MYTVLCFVFAIIALVLFVDALIFLVNHFAGAGLPHPLLTLTTIFVSCIGACAMVGTEAMRESGAHDAAISFFAIMLAGGCLWILFRASARIGERYRLKYTPRRIAFVAAAWIPIGAVYALHAAGMIPTLK